MPTAGRILVVDDNDLNRWGLVTTLQQQNYDVLEADNGLTALDLLANHPIDLVLLDLIMPQMNGLQILAKMKRTSSLKHVPVVVVSGLDDMELLVECIEAGASDYLIKPVAPALLKARLASSLASKRLHDIEMETQRRLAANNEMVSQLITIAHTVTQSPSLKSTLENILQISVTITYSNRGSLFLLNQDNSISSYVLNGNGKVERRPPKMVEQVINGGMVDWVLRHKQHAIIPDTHADDRWLMFTEDHKTTRSALCLPILYQQEMLGVLTVTHTQAHHFRDEMVSLMQAAVDQIALALRNAQLYEEQRRLATFQNTLYETLSAVSKELTAQAIMETAVTRIAHLTQWPTVAFFQPDSTQTNFVLQTQAGPNPIPPAYQYPLATSVSGDALRSHESRLIPDIATDPNARRNAPAGLESAILVPLHYGEHPYGVLVIGSNRTNAFSSNDIGLADALGDIVSLALSNAYLYATEQERLHEVEAYAAELDMFAGTVAHDLSNLLTGVVGYAEVLERIVEDERARKYIAKVKKTGFKMSDIIQELLQLARVRQGELVLQSVDLHEVATEAVQRLTTDPTMSEANIVWHGDEWPFALGHAGWIEEVWVNYLSNALKYGGISPLIELGASRLDDQWVKFWVRDNGVGLSADDQERLFTQFERLDQISVKGHGLGLTICKRIVEKLGGQVGVESTLGEGSTFYFTLMSAS